MPVSIARVDLVNMLSTVPPALVQEDRTNLAQVLHRAIVIADGSSYIRVGQVEANAGCQNVFARNTVLAYRERFEAGPASHCCRMGDQAK